MRLYTALMKVRKYLTDDLLLPKYKNKIRVSNTAGHCYVATEALFNILSPKQQLEFKPHYIKVKGDTHWFLMNKKKGNVTTILDPTFDQFKTLPNYDKAKRAGFLTKTPSKRTIILLERIKKNGSKLRTKNA
jgi:hypothetical protein